MISKLLFFLYLENVVIYKLSSDLPESKITTTTDKDIFKYLSQNRSDLFGFEKKVVK